MPRVWEIEEDGGDPILNKEFAKERELFGDVLNTRKSWRIARQYCAPAPRTRPYENF